MATEKFWKLGIIGWPLGYSLSPLMHTAALKAAGLQGEYKEYKVKPEELKSWLATEAPKLDGFNVTMPHKGEVFSWLKSRDGISEDLEYVGAVNTVGKDEHIGGLSGFNTDGDGFLGALIEAEHRLKDKGKARTGPKQYLLLGAGGAARAIAFILADDGQLTIWNRHPERAQALADDFQEWVSSSLVKLTCEAVSFRELDQARIGNFDVIINATSAGMKGSEGLPLRYDQLHEGQIICDIVFEPRETQLIREARKRGCVVVTGDEMLAAQGTVAFEIWTRVPAVKVLPAMKKALDDHFAA